MRATGAHVGVALDGDADRAILVDERGEVVDGDEVMAHPGDASCTRAASSRHDTLVATVMSNLGLEVALRELGIAAASRTPVGDRYVVEEMLRGGYNLGGEQSGHVVFLDHNTTGDGLITALAVLALMVETGRPLSELRARHDALSAGAGERAACASKPDVDDAARRWPRAIARRRADARRARPRAGALLRHRAAAARHGRGRARADDPHAGRRHRRGRARRHRRPEAASPA